MIHRIFLRSFRFIAISEGLSFVILLFIAMPLKYAFDMPQYVRITGMIHGLLFVIFTSQVLFARTELKWPLKTCFILFVASIVPFGTFYADRKYLKKATDQDAIS